MLPREFDSFAEFEIGLLSAKTPKNRAVLARDGVGGVVVAITQRINKTIDRYKLRLTES